MEIKHIANIKNKNAELRYKIQAFVQKYNPRPEVIEEREENGIKIKVYEVR